MPKIKHRQKNSEIKGEGTVNTKTLAEKLCKPGTIVRFYDLERGFKNIQGGLVGKFCRSTKIEKCFKRLNSLAASNIKKGDLIWEKQEHLIIGYREVFYGFRCFLVDRIEIIQSEETTYKIQTVDLKNPNARGRIFTITISKKDGDGQKNSISFCDEVQDEPTGLYKLTNTERLLQIFQKCSPQYLKKMVRWSDGNYPSYMFLFG